MLSDQQMARRIMLISTMSFTLDETLSRVIAEDEKEACKVANGAPLFVFNNGFHVWGAQPVESFKQALQQMHSEALETRSFQGQARDLNGCDN